MSVLAGRYITCNGIESRYEELLPNGSTIWRDAGVGWPTDDVHVVIAGQSTSSSTVIDLQGAPSISSISPGSQAELDFDTSGHGTAVIEGTGFGLDARDVVAVVFGPWPESLLSSGIDYGEAETIGRDAVVRTCVDPLLYNRVAAPTPSPSPTPSVSSTPSSTFVPSQSPSVTPSASATPSSSASPSATANPV